MMQRLAGAAAILLLALSGYAPADAAATPFHLSTASGPLTLDARANYWAETDPAAGLPVNIDTLASQGEAWPWLPLAPGQVPPASDKGIWFRFDVQTDPASGPWFLDIPVWGRGHAVFFYRDPQGQWVRQEAGVQRSVAQWPLSGRYPTFRLSDESTSPVRYWLHLTQSRTSYTAPLRLIGLPELVQLRDQQQFLLGGYFGLLLFVLLVAVARAAAWRDRHFALFGLFVSLVGLAQSARLGIGPQHLWPDMQNWNAMSALFLSPLAAAAGLLFVRGLAEPARVSVGLDRLTLATIVLLPAMTLVDAAWPLAAGHQLVSALLALAAGLIFVLLATAWRRGDDPDMPWLAAGFAPIVVMVFFPLSELMGWRTASFLTRYGVPIGVAVSLPVLLFALGVRSRRRREASVRARALVSTDALTGLANHHVLLVRLEAALQRARAQGQTCGLLGVRLTNVDAIRDEEGAETAERALVLAAAQLRNVIGEVDLAARVDNGKFVLLLEGPVTASRLQQCATALVAQGLRPSPMLPPGVMLKFHVAAALLPAEPASAEPSLHWVMQELQGMQLNGKKAIRALNF